MSSKVKVYKAFVEDIKTTRIALIIVHSILFHWTSFVYNWAFLQFDFQMKKDFRLKNL